MANHSKEKKMSEFKIAAFNTNGYGEKQKRLTYLEYFKRLGTDIIFIIDSRVNSENIQDIKDEAPDYNIYTTISEGNRLPTSSGGTKASRGVTVLIHKKLPIQVKSIIKDNINQNYLIIEAEIYSKKIGICGLYGPNADSPIFHEDIFNKLMSLNVDHTVSLGDYNVTLNPELDNQNYLGDRNDKARQTINNLIKTRNYFDCFREKSKKKRTWTYKRKGGMQKSRLDYSLLSNSLKPHYKGCELLDMLSSDHRGIQINIDFDLVTSGPGMWSIPKHLIGDEDFTKLVEKAITDTYMKYYKSAKYADFYVEASNKDRETFNKHTWEKMANLPMSRNHKTILEAISLEVKSETKRLSRNRRSNLEELIDSTREKIERLDNQAVFNEQEYLKQNDILKDALENMAKQNEFKQTTEWIKNGERVTPTLTNINRAMKSQKHIPELYLTDTNGNVYLSNCQQDIEGGMVSFFATIYKPEKESFKTIEDFLPKNTIRKKVDKRTAKAMDNLISLKELTKCVTEAKKDSTPGSDGIGYSFYFVYWKQMKHTVLKAANKVLISRKLPTSQKLGVINLIPKGIKNKRHLNNWRPICLLNCFYKLISAVLAKRLAKALDTIISPDQTGFLANRYINENNLICSEVIEDALTTKNKRGLMLAVDFSKAFDCLSHQFIEKSLIFFGFGLRFIAFIKTMLKGFTAAILHAGKLTERFSLGRGAKQGDPLASQLFITAV